MLGTLWQVFELLRAVDSVYHHRYRDPSRGLDLLPVLYGEAMKLHLDRTDTLIAAVQDVNASAADFDRALRDALEPEQQASTGEQEP